MNSVRRILLVEDDKSLGEMLTQRLSQDYFVQWANSKATGLALARQMADIDLLILDVGLGDGTGFELLTELKHPANPAVIFLTAQGDAESRLQGYELGADEYIPKPFHLKELLMRVEHVLEIHKSKDNKVLKLEDCSIDFSSMSILRSGGEIEYPAISDMKVLQLLIRESPKPVSRDQIMTAVWGLDKNPSIRTVDNSIVRLRQLLGDKEEKHIRSVRGLGYQWVNS